MTGIHSINNQFTNVLLLKINEKISIFNTFSGVTAPTRILKRCYLTH